MYKGVQILWMWAEGGAGRGGGWNPILLKINCYVINLEKIMEWNLKKWARFQDFKIRFGEIEILPNLVAQKLRREDDKEAP